MYETKENKFKSIAKRLNYYRKEAWYDSLSSEFINKSFKAAVTILNLEGSKNQMFTYHNKLIVD